MKLSLIFALTLFHTSFAHADCREAYSNEVKRLDGMLNPARVGLATSGATAIAVPVTLVATSAVVAPAAIIAAPAAVFAAGAFYAGVEIRKAVLTKTLLLIKQSIAGQGIVLERTTKKLQNMDADLTTADVAAQVVMMNNAQPSVFCTENGMGKPKLLGIVIARKKLKDQIFGATANDEAANEFDEQESF